MNDLEYWHNCNVPFPDKRMEECNEIHDKQKMSIHIAKCLINMFYTWRRYRKDVEGIEYNFNKHSLKIVEVLATLRDFDIITTLQSEEILTYLMDNDEIRNN